MTKLSQDPNRREALRSRAVAYLRPAGAQTQAAADLSTALGVLYDLASSPSTAPDALALLHELQVHQVEVDLQEEELRRSRAELETALSRQLQLYEHSPVGFFSLDADAILRELNQTGATQLGCERDRLRGRPLVEFLTPAGSAILRTMLGRLIDGSSSAFADLDLVLPDGQVRCLHASASRDPAGDGYLIALMAGAAIGPSVRSR